MYNSIKSIMLQIIRSPFFILSIFLSVLLFFTSGIYDTTSTGEFCLTPIQMLMQLDHIQLVQDEMCSVTIILRESFYGYLVIFAPVIMALPFVQLYCCERKTGYIRFRMAREYKRNYILTRVICAMLTGAVVAVCSYLLYTICILILFPGRSGWSIKVYLTYLGGVMIYGVFSVFPSLIFLSFTRNMYMVLACPFMLSYLWDITASAVPSFMSDMPDWCNDFLFDLRSYTTNLIFREDIYNTLILAGKVVLFMLLACAVFIYSFYRKGDCCA